MELLGYAWFSKNQKALVIGMKGKDGNIDENSQMVVFTDDLQRAKTHTGDQRSAKVYKSQPLPPRGEPNQ
jgi:hypothetical protein